MVKNERKPWRLLSFVLTYMHVYMSTCGRVPGSAGACVGQRLQILLGWSYRQLQAASWGCQKSSKCSWQVSYLSSPGPLKTATVTNTELSFDINIWRYCFKCLKSLCSILYELEHQEQVITPHSPSRLWPHGKGLQFLFILTRSQLQHPQRPGGLGGELAYTSGCRDVSLFTKQPAVTKHGRQ